MSNAGVIESWTASILPTYATPQLTLVRGKGARVWDADGNEYIDFVSGIATNSLGHAHPEFVAAVTNQLQTLGHVSNLYANEPNVRLARSLIDLIGKDGRVYFCNSGTEAIEAAIKISRRTNRTKIVSTENGFHGRTMGSLSVTGQRAKQAGFAPLLDVVEFVPFGDFEALDAVIDEQTAAFVLEPIQGEAGVVLPPPGYLRAAREVTRRHGALLIVDEVQTGIGRTGDWFAHTSEIDDPDIITLAKGLGGGLPVGACIALGQSAELLQPGQHGSTFAGGPVVSAAALAVIETIERDGLLAHVRETGALLIDELRTMNHPLISEIRGRGLMIGIQFNDPVAKQLQVLAQTNGFLLNATSDHVIRLVPPLTIEITYVKALLQAFPAWLDSIIH